MKQEALDYAERSRHHPFVLWVEDRLGGLATPLLVLIGLGVWAGGGYLVLKLWLWVFGAVL